ncbi:pyridoxal phosphate-dependent transferase [Cristinia sonorae]|uniref:Pyridoxal phosphate-dependent transferase n=1 Tax=Cristinia sonorae TaxID=1940300 RepID=A0A8K0UQE2_9AGAR|nr:pyridoxal phosphate-dependent transferase [Cristinia sonorae]
MSLSKRGQMRASLVAPGGPLHGYFQSIKNEWRPDDTSGVCRLDIAESDLMHTELADLTSEQSFRTLTALGAPTSVGGVNASSSNRLLTSLATLFNEQWSPKTPVLPSQIIAGAGCSILIEYLVHAICDPGDVVLTPAPFWPVFSTLVSKAGVGISVLPCLPASHANSIQASVVEELANIMTWTDATLQQWDSHVAQLLAAGKPPRALLLSNPLNPLGRCYSKSALTKAAEFCEKHDLLLISDEVFALSMHADALRSSWFSNSSAHGECYHAVVSVSAFAV